MICSVLPEDRLHQVFYKGMTHEMSFMIGNAKRIEDVTRDSFRMAAREAGLGERMALNRLDEMAKRFRPALESAAEMLTDQGVNGIDELKGTILNTYQLEANIAQLIKTP